MCLCDSKGAMNWTWQRSVYQGLWGHDTNGHRSIGDLGVMVPMVIDLSGTWGSWYQWS